MQPAIEFGLLQRCDGSCKATLGGTIAVCGVFGPVEARNPAPSDAAEGCVVEVQLRSYTAETSVSADQSASLLLRDVLAPCVHSKLFPRTIISLSVRVLADDGCAFSAAALAAVGALVDAGVPLLSLPVAVDCAVARNGNVLVFASRAARKQAKTSVSLCFAGGGETAHAAEPSLIDTRGMCSESMLGECVIAGHTASLALRQSLVAQIVAKWNGNLDLIIGGG